jgi:hypothetical protein
METHVVFKFITFGFVIFLMLGLAKTFFNAAAPAASKLGKARAASKKINRKVDQKVAKAMALAEVKKPKVSSERPAGATPKFSVPSSDTEYSRYESPAFLRKLAQNAKEAQAS